MFLVAAEAASVRSSLSFTRHAGIDAGWAGERCGPPGCCRPNVDFDRRVRDACDLCAVSVDSEHATEPWPAMKDAAVRRPPFVPSPSRCDRNVVWVPGLGGGNVRLRDGGRPNGQEVTRAARAHVATAARHAACPHLKRAMQAA